MDRQNFEDPGALLRALAQTTPDIFYAKNLDGEWTLLNAAAGRLLGGDPHTFIGRRDKDVLPAEQAEAIERHDAQVFAGRAIETEEQVTYPDGEVRWKLSLKTPLKDADGEVIGLVGISRDITSLYEARELQQTLAREVDHRANNLLTLVQSLIRLTRGDDVEAYRNTLLGRLDTLGRSHRIINTDRWDGADLRSMIASELDALSMPTNVIFDGPSVMLSPERVQAVSLIIHELTTNAVKYGALSSVSGNLRISWTLTGQHPDQLLALRWEEISNQEIRPPTRAGFGSRIIKSTIERQLKGSLAYQWLTHSMTCCISFPLSVSVADG